MLKKCAQVIKGEYYEWTKDEGDACPSTQEEKSQEFQSDLLPIRMGRTMSTPDLSYINPRGMKLA